MNDRENPLIAAKVRRLLGVSPSEAIPDTITLEQVVVLHFGKSRRSDLSRQEKDDGQAIIDAIKASGVAETRITETLEENHFRPIHLLSGHVDSTEYVTVIRKETFISNAALSEWWPRPGIEPGQLLAAWMGIGSPKEEGTTKPSPTATPPQTRRVNRPTVKQAVTPYASSLREKNISCAAKELLQIAEREAGSTESPFQKNVPGINLTLKECGRTCSQSTWAKIVSAIDTGKAKA